MKFFDFITGRTSTITPDYVAGIKGNKTVKIPPMSLGAIQLIGKKTGFDMNSTADQSINLGGGNKFVVTEVLILNPSLSLTTAASFQVNDAINQSGNIIFYPTDYSGQEYLSKLNDNTKILSLYDNFLVVIAKYASSLATIPAARIIVGNTLFCSLQTPQGVPATADIYIYGYILS